MLSVQRQSRGAKINIPRLIQASAAEGFQIVLSLGVLLNRHWLAI
jgi:hypothetical protein